MKLPDNVKPEDVINPSTGIFYKNPTHFEERERAKSQNSLVRAIRGEDRELTTEVISLDESCKSEMFPGVAKLKDMEAEELDAFFKNLVRSRRNIFKIHIKLGNYKEAYKVLSPKVRAVASTEPRWPLETGELLAEVFADKSLRIVELLYEITSAEEGHFRSTCEAYGASNQEDYDNKDLFNPMILIEYFSIE